MICFGVDIGGTTVKLGMFNEAGELLEKWEIPTRKENAGANIVFDICTSMDKHLDAAGYKVEDVKGVGVGVPGPVMKDGTVNGCVNLGWGVFNIERAFADSFHGIPCKAGNDANVAALGEYFKGGGRGYSDMLMVTCRWHREILRSATAARMTVLSLWRALRELSARQRRL